MTKILSVLILILGLSCKSEKGIYEAPTAKLGQIDLRAWDFEKQGRIQLYGEWEFYYNHLFTPEEFKVASVENLDYMEVPTL